MLRANRSLVEQKAGRYEATIYCVNKFGTSDIVWDLDPEDVSELHPATQYLSKVVAEYENHEVCGLIRIFEI